MNDQKQLAVLVDLPTFPKGVISLSLLSVGSKLAEAFKVKIFDLNIASLPKVKGALMYGLKVSSQNLNHAIDLTRQLRISDPQAKIIWGGELPTLLPEKCLKYADSVFTGLFESTAGEFITDLQTGNLKRSYSGRNSGEANFSDPDFSMLRQADRYYQFMGYPLETSRGCTEKCIFCMVHVMQKKNYGLVSAWQTAKLLPQYKGKFINVIDYNFGVDENHVVEVASLIKQSGAAGWMAEMCIELLDNERVLQALKDSGCRIIYCGLESLDQQSINSVHKMHTNHIENYERIIRKVQSYGIQIGAGIILGLEGTHKGTFDELFNFYQRMGIIYAKLTFLTYNPGTSVHRYARKKGVFVTEETTHFDGNRLTFLPDKVDAAFVARATEEFIHKYYSLKGIVRRSFNLKLSFGGRLEYILFALCYREPYMQWLKHNTLYEPANLDRLVEEKLDKTWRLIAAEKVLAVVRSIRKKTFVK